MSHLIGDASFVSSKVMYQLDLCAQAPRTSERPQSHCTSASLMELNRVYLVWLTQGLHVVKGYKQPKDLLPVSDVPMHVVPFSASRALAHQLFAIHSSLRWLCLCYVSVALGGTMGRAKTTSIPLNPWAARYNTGLFIKLTLKGVVFSFLFSVLSGPQQQQR